MKRLILLLLLPIYFNSFSQAIIVDDPDSNLTLVEKEALRIKRLNYTTNKIGVTVNPPPDFRVLKENLPPPAIDFGVFYYAFLNNDSTILITIALMPRDSIAYEKDRQSTKFFMPQLSNYNPNDQWLFNYRGTSDSTQFRPKFLDKEVLTKYNAEGGVAYRRKKLKKLYLGKYQIERNVLLNKSYKGIVEILFFKVPGAKTDVEDKIGTGYKMIKYN